MDDGHWYDWHLISWEVEEVENTIPAHILGFFDTDHSGSGDELMESVHVVIESSHDVVSMDDLCQSFVEKFKMPIFSKLGDSNLFDSHICHCSSVLCVQELWRTRQ